jgi:hypothetical protein
MHQMHLVKHMIIIVVIKEDAKMQKHKENKNLYYYIEIHPERRPRKKCIFASNVDNQQVTCI